MRDSPFYQSILREGAIAEKRHTIPRVLRLRFGPATRKDIQSALDKIEDLDTLGSLFALALDCRSLREFRAGLPSPAEE